MATGKIEPRSYEGHPHPANKVDVLYAMSELPPPEDIHIRILEPKVKVIEPAWAEYTHGENDPSIGSTLSTILETASPKDRAIIVALIREDIAASVKSALHNRSN